MKENNCDHETPVKLVYGKDTTKPLTLFKQVSPQNLLTFSFNLIATLVKTFKAIPRASPK